MGSILRILRILKNEQSLGKLGNTKSSNVNVLSESQKERRKTMEQK